MMMSPSPGSPVLCRALKEGEGGREGKRKRVGEMVEWRL